MIGNASPEAQIKLIAAFKALRSIHYGELAKSLFCPMETHKRYETVGRDGDLRDWEIDEKG